MQDLRGQSVDDPRIFAIQDPMGASEYFAGPASDNPANRAAVRESDMLIIGSKAGLSDRKAQKAYETYQKDPLMWARKVGADSPDILDWTAAQKKRYQDLLGVAAKKAGKDDSDGGSGFASMLGALALGAAVPLLAPALGPAAGAVAGAATLGRAGKAAAFGLRNAARPIQAAGAAVGAVGNTVAKGGQAVGKAASKRRAGEKLNARLKVASKEMEEKAKVKAEMIMNGTKDVPIADEAERKLIEKMMKEMEDLANG